MSNHKQIGPTLVALREFATGVSEKMSQVTAGQPEDQLRAPFETLLSEFGNALGRKVVCTGETPLLGGLGCPDYAVHVDGLLAGYVELKAPGKGADPVRFRGHDKRQFGRFSTIPNLLYTDANEWAVYRSGERDGPLVRISGDAAKDGKRAYSGADARRVERILQSFLAWEPVPPTAGDGGIDLKAYAGQLAPLCRMLREDVSEALRTTGSPLLDLQHDWRQLLFPDATNAQFADAYAQTVTFGLLLGRSEGADPLTIRSAQDQLASRHGLLSRALQVLTDVLSYPEAHGVLTTSLEVLLRVIGAVPAEALSSSGDPWLYFYEDFLSAYDSKLRKDAGVYYTPVEVVRSQVRLIDDLLANKLGKSLGFAAPGVVTLDPATGTGTYLLGVIAHTLSRVRADQGDGAVPGHATTLANNLHGFELMTGPYAVAELRVSRALRDHGAQFAGNPGPRIYLSDTLESPQAEPLQLPLFLRPIADQRAKALQVKSEAPVLVCLGNPPYDRHQAASGENKARTGGWVRWGDQGDKNPPILRAFIDPAKATGQGVHVKNLYNLYVYFWRWALWKVFEQASSEGSGIVSFISASSYIDGAAFCGMREHMRRVCDEIWILDLGGEGHAAPRDDNVFAIRTPVAIAVAARTKPSDSEAPAAVRYARIDGGKEEKLAKLDAVSGFGSVQWQNCPDEWQAPFRPSGRVAGAQQAPFHRSGAGNFLQWPLLTDLLPWQHSGVQLKRTWPIAPDEDTLRRRWRALLTSRDRASAFRETGDRRIEKEYRTVIAKQADSTPIAELPVDAPMPPATRYAYRSLDRQFVIADGRLMSRTRPDLWRSRGGSQVYLTGLLTSRLGRGPALTASAIIPDLHHFSGRGAKDAIPLYRTFDDSDPNIAPALLDVLGSAYGRPVSPEDFACYLFGTLAHPAFAQRFGGQLAARKMHVPITRDPTLFERARAAGARLLWLQTYGQRFVPAGKPKGFIAPGTTKCVRSVPVDEKGYPRAFTYKPDAQTLHVGEGAFSPVSPDVFSLEVSGLKVVQSWLGYRMRKGRGRKSSPLDHIRPTHWTGAFTSELLELLWVLEATVSSYPEQAKLLEEIVASACFFGSDFPEVPVECRKPPLVASKASSKLDFRD